MSETQSTEWRRIVREDYPPGVTCWVDLETPDPEAATSFYGELFGWSFEDKAPADQPFHYFEASREGLRVAGIGSQMEGAKGPAAWNTYVRVADADATAQAVRDAGGEVVGEPMEIPGAGRMVIFTDPQGAQIRAWEPAGHTGAQLVNEDWTWGFSGLMTSDPEAAASFYGKVFGWEASGIGEDWTFFLVPGYGDHLEQLDPGLRERLAGQGGPQRFEDVTAWLSSLEGQPEGAPPSWGVSFNVADVDAAAAKAKDLGGTVVVEPFDSPPVRTAVILDPQGAALALNRYTPPED
jgi:predicted enzyme related to lactoylglutathione lyase